MPFTSFKLVQTLLHAFQRLSHRVDLPTQRLRIILCMHRHRDHRCQTPQTQYRQAHCILPGLKLPLSGRTARVRRHDLNEPLLEMRVLRRRPSPACAWQVTGQWHCP